MRHAFDVEPRDLDVFCLPNTVRAVNCLCVQQRQQRHQRHRRQQQARCARCFHGYEAGIIMSHISILLRARSSTVLLYLLLDSRVPPWIKHDHSSSFNQVEAYIVYVKIR